MDFQMNLIDKKSGYTISGEFPENFNLALALCPMHFTEDSFTNLGFAKNSTVIICTHIVSHVCTKNLQQRS